MGLREAREKVSRQFNCLKSQLGCFRTTKNIEFYKEFDRNRPIETIDGYDKRSIVDRFRKCRIRRIVDGGPRCVALKCVIKRTPFRPLDLDLAVEMCRGLIRS